MKAIKAPVVLLITLVLVMTFSVISYAVTDKIPPLGQNMKDKPNLNGKQKPTTAPARSTEPQNNANSNSTSNSVVPNNASPTNTSNNQANTQTDITDAQILIQIKNINKQTDTIIASDNTNMNQINIQKSQVDNYINYIKKGSIVYTDPQLDQITTSLSKLTTDSQTVRNDTSNINSDINMVTTFSNNKNFKNALTKLNDELVLLTERSPDIINVGTDLTNTLSLLVQGQSVGSTINQPTASPSTSVLMPSNTNNTTN